MHLQFYVYNSLESPLVLPRVWNQGPFFKFCVLLPRLHLKQLSPAGPLSCQYLGDQRKPGANFTNRLKLNQLSLCIRFQSQNRLKSVREIGPWQLKDFSAVVLCLCYYLKHDRRIHQAVLINDLEGFTLKHLFQPGKSIRT